MAKEKKKTKLCKHCKTEIPQELKYALPVRKSKTES